MVRTQSSFIWHPQEENITIIKPHSDSSWNVTDLTS